MWSNLPFDVLANIFSYLSPDSLARARASCRSWHATSEQVVCRRRHPPWFVALPTRSWGLSCYAHNPAQGSWHALNLDRTTSPIKPIATIGGLILFKVSAATSLQLAICNPFTNKFRALPALRVARTNPAVGVVEVGDDGNRCAGGFKIYVAGGMSEAASGGGAAYQPTVEMYDSFGGEWKVIGAMPVEFAVRLTVWTPNESVYANGMLYWMTSARAYSVMGFGISSNKWRELSVPMADRLEFAALVPLKGRLAVVGGTCGGGGCVWELGADDLWGVVGEVPLELGAMLLGENMNWVCVKCVGIDGAICLYRDLGSGIVVWREVFGEEKWEWLWIHGCSSVQSFPIKGMLVRPNLARSTFLMNNIVHG